MIERLAEKNDLKKIDKDIKTRQILLELLSCEEYLEIVREKQLLIGCKNKNGVEILQIEDEDLAEFFRSIRDNFSEWKNLIKIRRSSHKQFLQTLQKTSFFNLISKRFEKNLLQDSQKLTNKIYSISDKVQELHERLQGVFIVHGKKKEVANSVDNTGTVIVTRIFENDEKQEFAWVKDIRYAKAIIWADDNKNTAKTLKIWGYDRLQVGRKKSKNIWVKNHK